MTSELQAARSVHESLSGVKGLLLTTAHTLTTVDLESDITLLTPGGTPRVLDEPEIDTVLSTPTGNHNGVVETSSTLLGIVKNTRRVGAEIVGASIDWDGHWLLLNSVLQSSHVILFNVVVRIGTNDTFRFLVFARSVLLGATTLVRVVRKRNDRVSLGVGVTSLHVTTVASTSTVGE